MTWWKQKEHLFIDEENKHKVLIVTDYDLHRGPMLRELLNKKMSEKMKEVVAFRSAGINADNGENIARDAFDALKQFGVRLRPYGLESNTATWKLVEEADCILTVDQYAYNSLKSGIDENRQQMIRLTDFSSDPDIKQSQDIPSLRNKFSDDCIQVLEIFDDCTDSYLKHLADKFNIQEEEKPKHWWKEIPQHWWEDRYY